MDIGICNVGGSKDLPRLICNSFDPHFFSLSADTINRNVFLLHNAMYLVKSSSLGICMGSVSSIVIAKSSSDSISRSNSASTSILGLLETPPSPPPLSNISELFSQLQDSSQSPENFQSFHSNRRYHSFNLNYLKRIIILSISLTVYSWLTETHQT